MLQPVETSPARPALSCTCCAHTQAGRAAATARESYTSRMASRWPALCLHIQARSGGRWTSRPHGCGRGLTYGSRKPHTRECMHITYTNVSLRVRGKQWGTAAGFSRIPRLAMPRYHGRRREGSICDTMIRTSQRSLWTSGMQPMCSATHRSFGAAGVGAAWRSPEPDDTSLRHGRELRTVP